MRRRAVSFLLAMLLAGAGAGAAAVPQAATPVPAQNPQGNMSQVPEAMPGSENARSLPAVPASNPRVQKLGQQLMCMCGCNQILIECNHQGSDRCLMHDKQMAELEQRVTGGESDSLILQSFEQEYGPLVLVVPPARGFDLTAWLMPIFASLFGLSLAIILVERWRHRAVRGAPVPAARPKARPDLVEQARAETENEEY